MSSTTLKSLDTIRLRERCTNFANTFSLGGSSDVDLNDLISKLRVIQLTLTNKPMNVVKIFEYVREVDCYPNIFIAIGSYLHCRSLCHRLKAFQY
jgi:hypothetical protein